MEGTEKLMRTSTLKDFVDPSLDQWDFACPFEAIQVSSFCLRLGCHQIPRDVPAHIYWWRAPPTCLYANFPQLSACLNTSVMPAVPPK